MAMDPKKYVRVQVRRAQQYRGFTEEGQPVICRGGEVCFAPVRHLELFSHAIERPAPPPARPAPETEKPPTETEKAPTEKPPTVENKSPGGSPSGDKNSGAPGKS